MHLSKNKTMATAVALFLMFAMAFSLIALPAVSAQAGWSIYIEGRTSDWRIRGEVRLNNVRQRETFTGVMLAVRTPGSTTWTYLGPFSTDDGRVTHYYEDFTVDGRYTFQYIVPAQGPLPVNPDTPDGKWYSKTVDLTFAWPVVPEGMYWDLPFPIPSTRLLLWERWRDQIPTWVYGVVSPNPVGVGQEVWIGMFNFQVPPGSAAGNDIRYQYSITITRPDGTTEILPPPGAAGSVYTQAVVDGRFVSDTTGSAFTMYTPAQVGNYSITVKFHELHYLWSSERNYYGVTLLESTHTTTLVVQEEQVVPLATTVYPLPTEYWTRPIEGQNTEWYRVSSNWLNNVHDVDNGGSDNRYQQDGIGPGSGHILWTKPTEDGGVVGGGNFSVPGEVFNAGHQYQTRFTTQIIMHGRLYYQEPITWSGGGGRWVCVDLRTGEEIWANWTMAASPSFGYYYDWDDMNQHGIVNPGWLFSSNFRTAIHPRYGTSVTLNITDVPSGTAVYGPKGEELRYVMNNAGSSSDPDWRLLQWNSSRVFISQSSGTRNASIYRSQNLDWNISAPWRMSGATIRAIIYNDVLFGSNGSVPSAPSYAFTQNATFWAVSLKPETRGQLLWMDTIELVTPDNQNLLYQRAAEGVFVFQKTPTLSWIGYSMYTGEKLWDTAETAEPESDFNPYGYYITSTGYNPMGHSIAYGKLFSTGYTGAVFCYDLYNGTLLWRYEAPTNMEKFKYYTMMIGTIADGKIYLGTHEHSADTPLFKGNRIRCLNVTTGEEIWTILGWANPNTMAIADGVLIYWNNYDHQVYAVGKGPSSTTVSIQNDVITHGNKVLVKGSVIDVSAGTKQHEQAMRFPNGVPAVSDASQGAWMEYVYMQKPRPADVTGVEVVISVLDPNNNYYEVGRTTGDASGFFSCAFTPEVPGLYTIIATFEGSESYWQSYAETAVFVEEALAATPPPTPVPQAPVETYFTVSTIAIILAIAIAVVLLLRKR